MKTTINGIKFVRLIYKMKSTYLNILIGIIVILFASLSGCDDELPSLSACGVEQPTENLPWLVSMLNDVSTIGTPNITSVDLYTYNSKEILRISWVNYYQLYDAPTGSVYDCDGHSLYMCGGNQPIDSCSIVINNSEFIGRIWENE